MWKIKQFVRTVPIWSAVTVMGIKLKDINKDIGTKADPESWGELHAKVIDCDNDLISRKGYRCWGMGICAAEVVDAIVRNTCICVTVSTYLKVTTRSILSFLFLFLFILPSIYLWPGLSARSRERRLHVPALYSRQKWNRDASSSSVYTGGARTHGDVVSNYLRDPKIDSQ